MEFVFVQQTPAPQDSRQTSMRHANSHKARIAHARVRRRRTEDYLRSKSCNEIQGEASLDQQRRLDDSALILSHPSSRLVHQALPQTVSGAFLHEPLSTFVGSLTAREHFIFEHCKNSLQPAFAWSIDQAPKDIKVVGPETQAHCPMINYTGQYMDSLRSNWVLYASTDIEFLKGFLLSGCRHLATVSPNKEFSSLTAQYKLQHLRDLQEAISEKSVESSRAAVAKALVLASDDVGHDPS